VLRSIAIALLACLSFSPAFLFAQEYASGPLPDMHWRMIGPFRGGRTRAATGIASQPNVFYVGQGTAGYGRATTMDGRGTQSSMGNRPNQSVLSPLRLQIQMLCMLAAEKAAPA